MGRLILVALAALVLATGCGQVTDKPARASAEAAPLPGPAYDPEEFDAQGQGYALRSVHEIASTGSGTHRYRLIGGREADGRLCLTDMEGTFENGSSGIFSCHEEDTAAALLPYAAWGLDGQPGAPFSFVGLARNDVERVVIRFRGDRTSELHLTRWDGFSWAVFAVTVTSWPETLSAYGPDGQLLSQIDLTERITPCSGGCTLDLLLPLEPRLTDAEADESRRIALADPLVARLLAGREYSVTSVVPWLDCKDRIFAATTTVRLAEPATLEADWPAVIFDAAKTTWPPYWEAVAHFRVTGLLELEITVDSEQKSVVGVQPGIEGDPRYSDFRIVKPPPREGIDCNGSSGD